MSETSGGLTGRVLDLLGPGGAFAANIKGWRVSVEQLAYARHVCALLEQGPTRNDPRPALGACEGATGIGKTFGYLVPLIVYAHLEGRRVAVATYTLDLLYAIEREAAPLANRIVAEALGRQPLTVALRVGRHEYVSAERTGDLVEGISGDDERLPALRSLRRFARKALAGKTTGRLRDWLEAGNELPADIERKDVTLTAWCSAEDHAAYRAQTERVASADLVLTTQASVIMHCLRRIDLTSGSDDLPAIDAVVIDEADRVPSMAEAVTQVYVPLDTIRNYVRSLDNGRRARVAEVLQVLDDAIARLRRAHGDAGTGGARRIAFNGAAAAGLRVAATSATQAVIEALAALRKLPTVRDDAAVLERVRAWAADVGMFRRALEGDGSMRSAYLAESPVRGYMGLGVAAIDPGRILAQLWSRDVEDGGVTRVFMTSATLMPPGDTGAAVFYREVGIDPGKHRVVHEACGQVEPAQHGQLDIVLADPRAPLPFAAHEEGESVFDEEWVRYAADMIVAAHKAGGRTLVLTASYRDVEVLGEELRRRRGIADIIAGSRGNRPAEVAAFVADAGAIWLTPSAWEGLDLPGMIANLVIARVPYRSISDGAFGVYRDVLVARGYDEGRARGAALSRAAAGVARKLRQGIGRPLRRHDDAATLWIADARFPLPMKVRDRWMRTHRVALPKAGDAYLANVIPTRFRTKPPAVFTLDRKMWRMPE